MSRVGIFGTGAYGISLAILSNRNKHDVIMWTKFPNERDYILTNHENTVLPGIKIDPSIKVTSDLKEFTDNSDIIIVALPVPFLKDCFKELANYNLSNKTFCLASKGILEREYLMVYQIYNLYIDNPNFSVISGPSFAKDIATNNPISLSLYANTDKSYNDIYNTLVNDYFKLERTNDLIGLEISGAIKNVMAIAAGLLHGLDFYDSTIALFMVRAIRDLENIIISLGGNKETLITPGAIGDLVLTCNSNNSRNFMYGYILATDRVEANNFLSTHTVEGYNTLKTLIELLDYKHFDIPVINYLKRIIFDNSEPTIINDYILCK